MSDWRRATRSSKAGSEEIGDLSPPTFPSARGTALSKYLNGELSAVLLAEAASYVEAALQVQPKSVNAVRSQMDKEKAAGQGG